MILISIILIFFAGCCKGVMDTLQFHYSESIFSISAFNQQFWNPDLGWTNKDKNNNPNEGRKKWFNLIPVPVFLTDGWHRFQFLFLNLFTFVIIFYSPIIPTGAFNFNTEVYNLILARSCDFIILASALRLGFIAFYNYILLIKKL